MFDNLAAFYVAEIIDMAIEAARQIGTGFLNNGIKVVPEFIHCLIEDAAQQS